MITHNLTVQKMFSYFYVLIFDLYYVHRYVGETVIYRYRTKSATLTFISFAYLKPITVQYLYIYIYIYIILLKYEYRYNLKKRSPNYIYFASYFIYLRGRNIVLIINFKNSSWQTIFVGALGKSICYISLVFSQYLGKFI